MKKHIFSLGVLAATLIAFPACQKESAPLMPEKNMVTFHFTAEKPTTKTAVVEGESKASYVWTEEDAANVKLFTVTQKTDDDGKVSETLKLVDNVSAELVSEKVLSISAEVEEAASYTFRATIAGDYTSGNKPKIAATQHPSDDSYDPATDLLVSEDVTALDALENLTLSFSRKGVISKMTLKGLEAGEKIKEVKVSSENIIGGYYDMGKIETASQTKEISLVYEDVVIPESGELPVYFVIAPNEAAMLTISAQSDKYLYKKELAKGVTFTQGQFTRFNVNLEGCATEITDEDYTGDWVITGTNGDKFFVASAYESGNNIKALEATFNATENQILAKDIENYKMHLEKITEGDLAGYYTIQDANGNYLYAASSSANQMKGKKTLSENDVNAAWSILVADGVWTVKADKSANRNVMQFNTGSTIVSCYATASQSPVSFYPYSYMVEDETPETILTVSVAEFNAAEVSTSQKYQLTGTIGGTINTKYGNFDLTDETGTVYVYGLTATELGYGATNDNSYASLGLKAGDKVTLIGYRGVFNEKIEVLYAYFVSKEEGAATPTIEVADVTIAAEGVEGSKINPTVTNMDDIEVGVFADEALTAECDWITFDLDTTIPEVTFSAEANEETTPRYAYFHFKVFNEAGESVEKTMKLTQQGAAPEGVSTATLTGTMMSQMTGEDGYGNVKTGTFDGLTWSSNGYRTKDLQKMLQLRVRTNNSGVTYLQLPEFSGRILSITLKVTNSNSDSYENGTNSDANILFQSGTTSNETPIVSGVAKDKVLTLDLSSENYKTGYITSGQYSFRIWEVTVTYE